MRIGVLCVRDPSGHSGGAERFFDGLYGALRAGGCEASLVAIESDESTFEGIEEAYLRCYDFDASRFDAVISTKAPTYLVRHPNHVCYLVHTVRVFYDMFERTFPDASPRLLEQRARIQRLDTLALSPPRTRRVFAIGHEVASRLREFNRINAEVVHPPLAFNHFRQGVVGDYILLPGRLHQWKRVDLAIEAMRHVRLPLRLIIAGGGEDEERLRKLAEGVDGVVFVGRVSDETLVELYANALAVAFLPVREDYGYVTVEAFQSGKPVVTCQDSGEASVLVQDDISGFVVPPDARGIARAFERLASDHALAVRLGDAGLAWVRTLRWEAVAPKLMQALVWREAA